MKKKSSIITPPPALEGEGTTMGNVAVDLSEEERHVAMLKLIRKGAPSVPVEQKKAMESEDPVVKSTLRMKKSIGERIEMAAKARSLKTSANNWITEAILDKLKKEGF
jgi:hypothetical protein